MTRAASQSPFIRHSAWKIWANPIFRRYCQSRLRVHSVLIFVFITVLIAGFMVALPHSIAVRIRQTPADAARVSLLFLLGLQGLIILFILGTAQVAGGMVAERDEGVIDYQRLIPMSPLSKVMGYLFGLPVREYVMFLFHLAVFRMVRVARSSRGRNVASSVWHHAFLSGALPFHRVGDWHGCPKPAMGVSHLNRPGHLPLHSRTTAREGRFGIL
jgi:hypothetical protein